MFTKLFTEHPAQVHESYWQHLGHASWFAGQMLIGAFACLFHALVPGTCTKTGSRIITRLHDRMVVNRTAPQTRDMTPTEGIADY